jgi:hypothetical protein
MVSVGMLSWTLRVVLMAKCTRSIRSSTPTPERGNVAILQE